MEREDGGRRQGTVDAYRGGRRASCGWMDGCRNLRERERERTSERSRYGEGRAQLSQWWDIDTDTVLEKEREKIGEGARRKERSYPVGIGGEMTVRENELDMRKHARERERTR